jgi:hypothetical protein
MNSYALRLWSLPLAMTVAVALGACSDTTRGRVEDTADDTSDSGDTSDSTSDPDLTTDTSPSDTSATDGTDAAPGDTVDLPDIATDIATDIAADIGDTALSDVGDTTPGDDTSDATSFVCACDYGQRCVDACTTPGDVCARDGYPDGTERRFCRPAATAGQGCGNQFNEYYFPCAAGLDCLFPLPDDADSPKYCYACEAQDVTFTGECAMPLGVFWDGTQCRSVSGCACTGADCNSPYASLAACERKTQVPCASR